MKKAFTMLELVFVIVVMGILAAAIIPSTRTNHVAESAIQLVADIRYTQHLAMLDDKYDATIAWYRDRWQIVFSGANNNFYSIVSDGDTTFAVDPSNGSNTMQNVELRNVTVILGGGCAGQTDISFDHLGRTMVGDLSDDATAYVAGQLMNAVCTIRITDGTENAIINIEHETGYAHII